jgi:hypothetical protein
MNYRHLVSCLVWIVASSLIASGSSSQDLSSRKEKEFDASRGVVLRGDAARELAETCGAPVGSSGWKISSIDIKDLEHELAPLLAAELKGAGSAATPDQYYRQYASGRIGGRDAIFINGFHESYLSDSGDQTSWRRRVVHVSDGGEHFWCAIYVKGLKQHFVTYRGRGSGERDTHFWFHGLG